MGTQQSVEGVLHRVGFLRPISLDWAVVHAKLKNDELACNV